MTGPGKMENHTPHQGSVAPVAAIGPSNRTRPWGRLGDGMCLSDPGRQDVPGVLEHGALAREVTYHARQLRAAPWRASPNLTPGAGSAGARLVGGSGISSSSGADRRLQCPFRALGAEARQGPIAERPFVMRGFGPAAGCMSFRGLEWLDFSSRTGHGKASTATIDT
jgi:hypothetical protein